MFQVPDVREKTIMSLEPLEKNFAKEMYLSLIVAKSDENVFFSPFSVHACLSFAMMGAAGVTEREMRDGLGCDTTKSKQILGKEFGLRLKQLNESPLVKSANGLYLMEGYDLKQNFNDIANKEFGARAQIMGFSRSEESAAIINAWVEEQTNNKIKNIVTPDLFNSQTRMVLLNAIAFKGFWENKFDRTQTKKAPFWINNTETVTVDMMHLREDLRYTAIDELDAKAIILPFKNSDIHMLVFVPNEREGLRKIEENLRHLNWDDFEKKTCHPEVILAMPKFKIEFSVNMNDTLKELGMKSVFDPNTADFSDLIVQKEQLVVSDVVHKACIEVNEEGAEAAAATYGRAYCCSGPKPVRLTINRPFLYVLATKSNEILFIGNLKKPKEA